MDKSKNIISEKLRCEIKVGIIKLLYAKKLIDTNQFNELLGRIHSCS